MIFQDEYIDDYYMKMLENDLKPKNNRYSNLNFSKLTADKKLIQINVDIYFDENFVVRDQIDWDLNEEKKSTEKFANNIVNELCDLIEPGMIEYNKRNIREQILDQILDHVEKNTFLPRIKLIKKEKEAPPNSHVCINCNSIIYNPEYCVNCMYTFEKKVEKKSNNEEKIDDSRQTERQKILELRQKNINVDELSVTFSQEGRDKKVCKKCGEMNSTSSAECKNCKYKFPLISFFDANMNLGYAYHFWNKVNKNSTVQQLKNFPDYFTHGDTCSLKYLYNKIKYILEREYQEILTEDAYSDLIQAIEKIYFSFSNPTLTTEKVFDSAYLTKYSKARPKNRMLNFNNLTDIKEGWLPDNLPDKNVDEKKEEKVKCTDPLLKRKRGRPKKVEIFKNEIIKEDEIQIILQERDKLLQTDIIVEEDMHYDFCGICEGEGKLICCETCSSAYHFECLGYDKFPRGKFKCYFCKIVKVGIDDATTVDKNQMKLIKKLITYNRKAKWQSKAQEFLDVLKAHHCSCFFKSAVPSDFTKYYEVVKEPIDLTMIESKLNNKDYSKLKDFIQDLYVVWSNFKEFYPANSFFHKQANTMQNFMTHLIKEEGVFDAFDAENVKDKDNNYNNTNTESRKINKEEIQDESEFAVVI